MRNGNFIKGVEIIGRYIIFEEQEEEFGIHAEHDQIWFGAAELVTSSDDVKKLEELGWFIDEDSWSCFT